MNRPQFSLKTIFWVTAVAGILFAIPRYATKFYRISLAAAVRARIEERRKEMEQPSNCGVVNASAQLELRELEETLQNLESNP